MTETFARQRDLMTPNDVEGLDLDIVGAGMLGGAILLCLCKMGFGITNRITITDFDRCERHNLPTQWFRSADVALGRSKVKALMDLAAWIADDRAIVPVSKRFTGAERRKVGPAVVLAVDSLAERRAIWGNVKRRTDVRLLVDARAGAEVVEVHAIEPGSADAVNAYERSLEGEPAREPCTRQAIAYAPLAAAAAVGSLLRAWVRGEDRPRRVTLDLRNFWIDRELP